MENTKQKLCYIIPEYNKNTPTHFNYLYKFSNRLSEKLDVFVIVEKVSKGSGPFSDGAYVQKFSFSLLRCFENFIILLRARKRGYKDFYVHYSFLSAFNASLITKIFGGRVFYWNCGMPWKYMRSFFRESFERMVYKMITFHVTGTKSLAVAYSSFYGTPLEKIIILPNWIDLNDFKAEPTEEGVDEIKKWLNIPPNTKIMLFVHRLSKRKGAHMLPEIFNRIKDERSVLIIVGDGPEKQNLEIAISEYELFERVRFMGWFPQRKIGSYFRMADVFIMPSEEEGFPHVLLEAMAAGTPFVATDVGGVKEMIPPFMHEFVVFHSNIDQFAEKTQKLLNMPVDELQQMEVRLKEWVKQYDISRVFEEFIKMVSSEG
ncbi:MAG: hypothetical protein COU46_03680 [Candidatus Niyogibacteria bacterium CG10_big_fil_rev_8_21_14_0_10_42_19]|uniref:Glycosyl transferase family 1 domain-containing protein n=1 Tax=Candidatus Niyogibacteria bacterium CG10_big_fil_rev_8_21_14_0_10_42_19 TaxID=1974725 RepID=A0A2H0TGE5_9BACT|nr:MAG: hypothetical protein COU46_03680 [Candidatus Niyogibacteria bacterium CG10_big_fil_rev_8_21_14_0_10_42_19]